MAKIRVTVWNEYRHEKRSEVVGDLYPEGIHGAIAGFLGTDADLEVTTATLDEPEHGLTDDVLAATDVLVWWGHMAHHDLSDEVAEKVVKRVWNGMGFIALHSAHFSKVFKRLMGTTCDLKWRGQGEKERVWVVEPSHPIAANLEKDYFEIPLEEMYGERFDIPAPDEIVFMSWFAGGNVFRSGCCYRRNQGKIFYFQPGHETFPTFFQKEVQTVIHNAVYWAAPNNRPQLTFGFHEPLEPIE